MIPDIDVWRSAALLVKQHGDNAPARAVARADELLAAGDLDGHRVWLRILSAVGEQLRGRAAHEPLH